MALDVYVMPLWRFKVGDFHSPVESATGLRPTILTAEGIVRLRTRVRWLARWRARRQVAIIRKAVEASSGRPAHWNDEGGVVYSSQSPGFTSLRTFAKWLDCRDRFPSFEPPKKWNDYEHPILAAELRLRTCPQLVEHSCYSGYFLPCEFESLVQVEPFMMLGRWPMTRQAGSTPQLLRELDRVQEVLQVPDGYEYDESDPFARVKESYRQLREIARLSNHHGLPMIFWG